MLTYSSPKKERSVCLHRSCQGSTCVRSRQKGVRRPPLSLSWFFHRKEEARQENSLGLATLSNSHRL